MTSSINHNFEVIIIGSGGAGLMAALSCASQGIKNVAVISKVFPTSSHTVAAKGGINAALGNVSDDNYSWHCFDTIKGSDYLADHDAVEFMCKQAPQTIIDLENMGVVFSRNDAGKIDQRAYGGQKTNFGKGVLAHRACFSKDRTGHTILQTLYQQCLQKGVKFFNEFFVTDLLMSENNNREASGILHCVKNKKQCFGALAIDLESGKLNIFKSKITILATGGYGQIYRHNTSSDICTGDGNALILKENLELQDMEFIQFHPTSLYGSGLLISEAARGEGGNLLNGLGEKFMEKYAPEYGDLASRDVIARAIATEIKLGRGGGENKDKIYLDIRHLGEEKIKQKIPTILEVVGNFSKINPLKEPIPIAIAAHYTMGGIPTDLNCNVEGTKNLLAIGEAACVSVHGSNRLGCNSLLDILVFGNLSGKTAEKLLKNEIENFDDEKITNNKINQFQEIFNQKGDKKSFVIKNQLKKIVENSIGVFRNEELLSRALEDLFKLKERLKSVEIKNKNLIFNNEIIEFLETENLLLQAIVTAYSALKRCESRGAHFRDDFPDRNDQDWLKHSLVKFNVATNKFEFKTKEVRVCEIGEEKVKILPETRKY